MGIMLKIMAGQMDDFLQLAGGDLSDANELFIDILLICQTKFDWTTYKNCTVNTFVFWIGSYIKSYVIGINYS